MVCDPKVLKMPSFAIPLSVFMVLAVPAYAEPGIWTGKRAKDPITDNWNSQAAILSNDGDATFVVRCRNHLPDIMVRTRQGLFDVPSEVQVTYMRDGKQPITVRAIATQPDLIALDARNLLNLYTDLLGVSKLAVRFSSRDLSQRTFIFEPALKRNTLHLVGRVLADCALGLYPENEVTRGFQSTPKQ